MCNEVKSSGGFSKTKSLPSSGEKKNVAVALNLFQGIRQTRILAGLLTVDLLFFGIGAHALITSSTWLNFFR